MAYDYFCQKNKASTGCKHVFQETSQADSFHNIWLQTANVPVTDTK